MWPSSSAFVVEWRGKPAFKGPRKTKSEETCTCPLKCWHVLMVASASCRKVSSSRFMTCILQEAAVKNEGKSCIVEVSTAVCCLSRPL